MFPRDTRVAVGIRLAAIDPFQILLHERVEGRGLVVSPPLEEIEFGLERDLRLFADQSENFRHACNATKIRGARSSITAPTLESGRRYRLANI
jgi:hypothetical protein